MNLQYKYVNYHPKYPNLWMTLVNNISTIPMAPSVPADGKCGLFQRYEIQFGGLGSLQDMIGLSETDMVGQSDSGM